VVVFSSRIAAPRSGPDAIASAISWRSIRRSVRVEGFCAFRRLISALACRLVRG